MVAPDGTEYPVKGVFREIVDGFHVVGHGDDGADEEETEAGDAEATDDIEEDELPWIVCHSLSV